MSHLSRYTRYMKDCTRNCLMCHVFKGSVNFELLMLRTGKPRSRVQLSIGFFYNNYHRNFWINYQKGILCKKMACCTKPNIEVVLKNSFDVISLFCCFNCDIIVDHARAADLALARSDRNRLSFANIQIHLHITELQKSNALINKVSALPFNLKLLPLLICSDQTVTN